MEDKKAAKGLLYELWNSLSISQYEVPTMASCSQALVLGTGNRKPIRHLFEDIGQSSNSTSLTLIVSPHLKNDFSDKDFPSLRILEYPLTGIFSWQENPSWWRQAFEESFDAIFFHINQENLYAVQNILDILLHSGTRAAVYFNDKNYNCYSLPTEEISGAVDVIAQINQLTERDFQRQRMKPPSERPRILLDCRILAEKAQTGIHRYANQLLYTMPRLIPETDVQMIGCNELSVPDGVTKIPLDLPLNNHARAESLLGLSSRLEDSDVIFSPYYPIPEKRNAAGVLTIHDLIPLVHPEWFSNPNTIVFFEEVLRESAQKADKVIADSHSTKDDILHFYEIDECKVEVVHLAPNPLFSKPPDVEGPSKILPFSTGRPYFLSVSTFEPRKNLVRTIKAYEVFRNQDKSIDPLLILVGKKGWKSEELNEALERSQYKESIVITGFVDDKTLISIYQNSLAFLYPSLYEGFGLPVLEAMACGTPVITSDCSSLIEIAKDCALCCNPYNVDEIAQAMNRVCSDQSCREQLIANGFRNADTYTWDKTTSKTIKVITSCLAH